MGLTLPHGLSRCVACVYCVCALRQYKHARLCSRLCAFFWLDVQVAVCMCVCFAELQEHQRCAFHLEC